MRRLRGLKHLVHDAFDLTVDLVEEGHESTARNVRRILDEVPGLAEPARLVDEARRMSTSSVLNIIRGVHNLVETATEATLDAALPDRGTSPSEALPLRSDLVGSMAWVGDAALGAINGVIGDHLHRQKNGLSVDMQIRRLDRALEVGTLEQSLDGVSDKIAVFVHGLAATEWSWCLNAAEYHGDPAANFGSLLDRDAGYTPLWVRYNTGRHVSENGRDLAALLAKVVAAWPVPIREIILVGHSMGGLVARSTCHYALAGGAPAGGGAEWLSRVSKVFCLGTPHHGAPLEKFGNIATSILGAIDVPGTQIPARILNGRSAGIKDLRYGYVVDEDWLGRDPDAFLQDGRLSIPLVSHITYYFVSATVTRDPEHPLGQLIGDLLVRVPSASGPNVPTWQESQFDITCHGGVFHHHLQNHPAIYARLLHATRQSPVP